MLEIIASIFAFPLFLFLSFLFWNLFVDSDNTILSALFGTLTVIFILCAGISCLVCISALLMIGGTDNG